jgi:hypothetical protein
VPEERISVADSGDFSGARFMESFESKHSDHDFTGRLSDAVGISAPPLRLDSQAKYGGVSAGGRPVQRVHVLSCAHHRLSNLQSVCLWADVLIGNECHHMHSVISIAPVHPDPSAARNQRPEEYSHLSA